MDAHDDPPRAPRWVKITWITLGTLAVLVALAVLLGGHGPGRHL